jgi:hypothetical protein
MTDYQTLRALMGPSKFDNAVKKFKERQRDAHASLKRLSSMDAEPDNTGLSIEEGRDALKRAADRSYDLPHVSEFGLEKDEKEGKARSK